MGSCLEVDETIETEAQYLLGLRATVINVVEQSRTISEITWSFIVIAIFVSMKVNRGAILVSGVEFVKFVEKSLKLRKEKKLICLYIGELNNIVNIVVWFSNIVSFIKDI